MINHVIQKLTVVWFDGDTLTANTTMKPLIGAPEGRVVGAYPSGKTLVMETYRAWSDHEEEPGVMDRVPAAVMADLRLRYRQPDRAVMRGEGFSVDPAGLMGPLFTVRQLRKLYEQVFGYSFLKDTFRRAVIGALDGTGMMSSDFGRPAELFRIHGAAA